MRLLESGVRLFPAQAGVEACSQVIDIPTARLTDDGEGASAPDGRIG